MANPLGIRFCSIRQTQPLVSAFGMIQYQGALCLREAEIPLAAASEPFANTAHYVRGRVKDFAFLTTLLDRSCWIPPLRIRTMEVDMGCHPFHLRNRDMYRILSALTLV